MYNNEKIDILNLLGSAKTDNEKFLLHLKNQDRADVTSVKILKNQLDIIKALQYIIEKQYIIENME